MKLKTITAATALAISVALTPAAEAGRRPVNDGGAAGVLIVVLITMIFPNLLTLGN